MKMYPIDDGIDTIIGNLDLEMPCKVDNNMEWISVKDRLPDEECIAVGYNNRMAIGYIGKDDESDTGYAAYEIFITIGDHTSYHDIVLCDVTHWMPLPKPPTN